MGVLRSRRAIAYSEFERHMWKIHINLESRMHALPARYKKHVCDKLYAPLSRAYDALIIADEQKGSAAAAKEKRQKYFKLAAQSILRMEKPVFHTLKKEKFKRLAFLGKMAELHRYTFQKTAHAPNECFDALSTRIDDFCTNALYAVVMANEKMPQTRAEAQARDAWLKDAIDNLNAMQRPMVGLWNIMQYSEKTMDEWAGMIDEEIRILTGLRDADRQRYKSLQ